MRIIIIGAGISGLSTYLFLKKHILSLPSQHHEVKIYEAYDISKYIGKSCTPTLSTTAATENGTSNGDADGGISPSAKDTAVARSQSERAARAVLEEPNFTPEAIASAIGISRNGLNVLARLFGDDEHSGEGFSGVLTDMLRGGHAANKWQMSNSRGWRLVDVDMTLGDERKDSSSNSASTNKRDERLWKDSPVNLVMISRQAFWSILLKHVVANDGPTVVQRRKVAELVVPLEDSAEKVIVKFADGDEEAADLVIGADGLRSVVRKAIFQPQSPSPSSPAQQDKAGPLSWLLSPFKRSDATTAKDYITPHYEGLVGVGSFIPSSLLSTTGVPPGVMSIVFGPNGFFGHGYVTSTTPHPDPDSSTVAAARPGDVSVFWSTFASKSENPFPLPTHTTSGDTRAKPYEFDRSAALKTLLARHRNWKNPTIQAILKYVEETGGIDGFWPTWTTPELPTWSKNGRVVLVGDAAHALQPSSGQGACQGLEDAEGLALLLKHYLTDQVRSESKAATQALQKFDKLRLPRLRKIYERSQKMSGMKSDMGFLTEMMMYAAIKVMMLLHDGYQDELIGYDLPADVERVVGQQ